MMELGNLSLVEKGDVLQVARPCTDAKTGKPYTWRFFGVVVHARVTSAKVRVIGKDYNINVNTRVDDISLLDPDEWPDGVHMFRTQMILKGEIDID